MASEFSPHRDPRRGSKMIHPRPARPEAPSQRLTRTMELTRQLHATILSSF